MKARTDSGELKDIQAALDEIKADLRKLTDAPARDRAAQHGMESKAVDVLLNQLLEDVDVGLEKGMVKRCGMREKCKAVFTDLLQKTVALVGSDSVSEAEVNKFRTELEKRRTKAPKSQCAKCFGEVSDMFDKHIRVTRSLKIYRSDEETRKAIKMLSEDSIIKDVLEPVSNRQRLQILKMLSSQARSFSYISDQSGLRGGNLLFHLRRLSDTGMIVQQHERGDYLLTEKGYMVLHAISELASSLDDVEYLGEPTPMLSARMEKQGVIAPSKAE